MPSRLLLIDGRRSDRAAPIDPDDPAITLGVSVFETLRTFGRRPLLLGRHHARLRRSAARLGIQPPSLYLLRAELTQLLERWPPGVPAAVRITLTGGGRRILRASPAPEAHRPLRCVRRPWAPVVGLETAKHGSRAGWVVDVRDSGADDVIWEDPGGLAREASTGAVLARIGGAWVSPPAEGILPSVTLGLLSELVPISRQPLSLDDVDALWLCSSLKLFSPVVTLDGAPVGQDPAAHAALTERLAAWVAAQG